MRVVIITQHRSSGEVTKVFLEKQELSPGIIIERLEDKTGGFEETPSSHDGSSVDIGDIDTGRVLTCSRF